MQLVVYHGISDQVDILFTMRTHAELAAIANNTFPITSLLEELKDLSLFSIGKPQIAIYKSGYKTEINIYLDLQDSATQIQIWRGGVVTEDSTSYTEGPIFYTPESSSSAKEMLKFLEAYGDLRAYRGALSSSFGLLDQLTAANPSVSEEVLITAAFAGSILTHDRLAHLQATPNAMDPWAKKQIQRVLDRYTQATIIEAGAERVAYLARSEEFSLGTEELIFNSPISWLPITYAPMLHKNFSAISVPSHNFTNGGDRELLWLNR